MTLITNPGAVSVATTDYPDIQFDASPILNPGETITAATVRVQSADFTRQIALRNTGTNTLWLSLDNKSWFDVACGTSWDDRVSVRHLWYCTQIGKTRFPLLGVALLDP